MNKRILKQKEKYEGTSWLSNKCGDFIIIEYINARSVVLRFTKTGYITITDLYSIKKGKVKDRLHPSVSGVGFVGEGVYTLYNSIKIYYLWAAMLGRCYDKKCHENYSTYIDCTVTPEWHNFQNFAKWCEDNYIEGYHLDKDIKVEGNRVYGPDTCMFVSPQENTEKACAKYWKFVSPEGKVVEIYNIAKFCREKGLNRTNMYGVHQGKQSNHKSWTKYVEEVLG
jgi:hypothetical protein